ALKKIVQNKNFKKYFLGFDEEMKLVRMPKDYDELHPYADWLKLKSFTVTMPIDEAVFSDKKVIDKICTPFKELNALNQFLNAALD
ncbi:MAG TPA: DUF2461 family protein, partial [Cytophaga sp.]|nr:DUF2461 family protein [Cytophaga sp.]